MAVDDKDTWEDNRTFTEVFAAVKYKITNNIPMMTAKEELMQDFIEEWAENFGFESCN